MFLFPLSQLCIFCFWSVFDRQPTETEVRVKRASRWNPDEAVKVAEFLGEKSLMKDSCEGRAELRIVSVWVKRDSAMSLHGLFRCKELAVVENNNRIWNDQGLGAAAVELSEAHCESKEQRSRKQWAEPSHSLLQKLENANIISSDSLASHGSMTDTAYFS